MNEIGALKLNRTELTEVVECDHCKERMITEEEQFITVWGNITVGLHAGLIGNNFDEQMQLARTSYICFDCIAKHFFEHIQDAVTDRRRRYADERRARRSSTCLADSV